MKRLILIIISFVLSLSYLHAQDMTVVAQGSGSTEREAVMDALRSSLERAYGAFFTSAAMIRNDKLISDEAVSISKGNIKSYELTSSREDRGRTYVTLNAVVSMDNLITYAISQGSKVEFDGKAFATSAALKKFKVENAKKAIDILLKQVKALSSDLFDVKVVIDESNIKTCDLEMWEATRFSGEVRSVKYGGVQSFYGIPIKVTIYSNPTSLAVSRLIKKTLSSIEISETEYRTFLNLGLSAVAYEKKFYPVSVDDLWHLVAGIDNMIDEACFLSYVIYDSDFSNIFGWHSSNYYTKMHFASERKCLIFGSSNYFVTKTNRSDYKIRIMERCFSGYDDAGELNSIDSDSFHTEELSITLTKTLGFLTKGPDKKVNGHEWGDEYHYFHSNYRSAITQRNLNYGGDDVSLNDFVDKLKIDEIQIPHKKTKEEKALQKKSNITIPSYDIKYENPRVVYSYKVIIPLPKEKMDSFKGLEVSHKDKLMLYE